MHSPSQYTNNKSYRYMIIAGKGSLPLEIAENLKKQNINFIVVTIGGFFQYRNYLKYTDMSYKIPIGIHSIRKVMDIAKSNGITHTIMAGSINRITAGVTLLSKEAIEIMQAKNAIDGDDSLLRRIVDFVNKQGVEVVPAYRFAGYLLAQKKQYTHANLDLNSDILETIKTLKDISRFDIGQSAVVQDNIVLALEAIEGTDKMIKRVRPFIKKNKGQAILYKISKENQTLDVDIPTIGINTIKNAIKSNINAIVIESNKVLFLDQSKATKLANKYNLSIIGI